MQIPTLNYIRVIDRENDAKNKKKSPRKSHRNGKRKFMKAYLYTNSSK